MNKNRMEAFSDGVVAILITIMVLELKLPHGADFAALSGLLPVFLTYVLSFIFIGIYWNSHHHMLSAVKRVNGKILWANLFWLFWLSLIPFVTGWMGENHFAALPTAFYGGVLLMCGIAYTILQYFLVQEHGRQSKLAAAVGSDLKGKTSLLLYALAIPLAFVHQWIADGLFITVALMWLIPDRRIETKLREELPESQQVQPD